MAILVYRSVPPQIGGMKNDPWSSGLFSVAPNPRCYTATRAQVIVPKVNSGREASPSKRHHFCLRAKIGQNSVSSAFVTMKVQFHQKLSKHKFPSIIHPVCFLSWEKFSLSASARVVCFFLGGKMCCHFGCFCSMFVSPKCRKKMFLGIWCISLFRGILTTWIHKTREVVVFRLTKTKVKVKEIWILLIGQNAFILFFCRIFCLENA